MQPGFFPRLIRRPGPGSVPAVLLDGRRGRPVFLFSSLFLLRSWCIPGLSLGFNIPPPFQVGNTESRFPLGVVVIPAVFFCGLPFPRGRTLLLFACFDFGRAGPALFFSTKSRDSRCFGAPMFSVSADFPPSLLSGQEFQDFKSILTLPLGLLFHTPSFHGFLGLGPKHSCPNSPPPPPLSFKVWFSPSFPQGRAEFRSGPNYHFHTFRTFFFGGLGGTAFLFFFFCLFVA